MSRQLLQEESLCCQDTHGFRHALSEPMRLTMSDTLPRDARVRPRLDVRKMNDVALAQNMDPSNCHIESRFVLSTTALEKAVYSALSGEARARNWVTRGVGEGQVPGSSCSRGCIILSPPNR